MYGNDFWWNNFFVSGDPMYYLMLKQKGIEKKWEDKTEAEKEQSLIEDLQG
ncbi:MAG: hypothetical protein IKV47_05905 [Oscillospiraceae bacterium]|nr:hypothetical protein [Oscillospiraceae bacterium]MBR5261687.1 hypothetical protein [Oscillospiraceae bacterium]